MAVLAVPDARVFELIKNVFSANIDPVSTIRYLIWLRSHKNLPENFLANFMDWVSVSDLTFGEKYNLHWSVFRLLEYCYESSQWETERFIGRKILRICIQAIDRECLVDFGQQTNNINLKRIIVHNLKLKMRWWLLLRKIWMLIGGLVFALLLYIIGSVLFLYDPDDKENSQKYINIYISLIAFCALLIFFLILVRAYASSLEPLEEYERDFLLSNVN